MYTITFRVWTAPFLVRRVAYVVVIANVVIVVLVVALMLLLLLPHKLTLQLMYVCLRALVGALFGI